MVCLLVFCHGAHRPLRWRPVSGAVRSGLARSLEYAAPDLVQLDGLEQGLEVAVAKALVSLALDELEEDGAELVLAEDLKQQCVLLAVDQDLAVTQCGERLAVAGDAL